VLFLLVIPVVFVLAEAWLIWSGRTRKEPGVMESVERHRRALAALAPNPTLTPKTGKNAADR
jgi:hypothetical protein